jgi:hypothetical protein
VNFAQDVAKRETLAVLVSSFKLAVEEISLAYTLLEKAQNRLQAAYIAKIGYSFDTNCHNQYHRVGRCAIEEVTKRLKRDAWSVLVERLELRRLLSIKRREELDNQLREKGDELPDITEANILAMLTQSAENVGTYVDEAAREVFSFIRPTREGGYKTNQVYRIGPKVILTWMVESDCRGGFRPNYHREKYVTAIDNVFHMLDGKGPVGSYHGPLYDAIAASGAAGVGETDFFRFRCYRNQNLHLQFKRLDLLDKLNLIGGGGELPR